MSAATGGSTGPRTPAPAGDPVVRECDAAADGRWDAYVDGHPAGSIHHTSSWLQVLSRAYGHAAVPLLCEGGNGRVLGVLPLMERRGMLSGRLLSSLPHTPFAGPLADEPGIAELLVDEAVRRVQQPPVRPLLVKTSPLLEDPGPLRGLTRTSAERTFLLELGPDVNRLDLGGGRNRQRLRWSVRRAAQQGVRVRAAADLHDLRRWYRLYLLTMRRHVSPPKPYRFFHSAWQRLQPRGAMQVLLAETRTDRGSQLVAGSVFWRFQGTVTYAFSGSLRLPELRANDALQWHALTEACRDGFLRYDFGEVDAGDRGLAEFKTKWGGRPLPLLRYRFDPSGTAASDALPGSGPWAARARPVWQRLPLPVTAAVGTLAYRAL